MSDLRTALPTAAAAALDVVVFGLDRLSVLAAYVLAHESAHRVVGYTAHAKYVTAPTLDGLPVTPFERLERDFPPERVALLAPLGWRRMGGLRADVWRAGKAKGYRFISHVSPRALCWPDLRVGENCMVYDGVIVQPFARIGDNCVVRAGALLSHDVVLGDHCYVAASAVIGGRAQVGEHCVIGLNATVCSGVRVAPRCFVTAGAVLTADTEPGGIYRGNPARRSRLPSDGIARLRI